MPVPIWVGHYIGLNFKEHGRDRHGIDCWGLVRLVMGEQFGVSLPSYATQYDSTTREDQLAPLIEEERKWWIPVEAGKEQLGDVVVLRMRGHPIHVGFVIEHGRMLHAEVGIGSVLDSYKNARWHLRVTGFYRYGAK
jgi:cell wall-associated NlpC family hydrolase